MTAESTGRLTHWTAFLLLAVALCSACAPDFTDLGRIFTGPPRTSADSANRTTDGNWSVRVPKGTCLVYGSEASTAEAAIQVCHARLG